MTNLFDVLTVFPNAKNPQYGQLRIGDKVFVCVLGRNGVSLTKHEGDGTTPVGRFLLHHVLYRADRIARPDTALPAYVIGVDDGWCNDPTDPLYNQPVKLPYAARTEMMWREDRQYDVLIVIGHNDKPVMPGRGSAVFIHLAKPDGDPTAGCVALDLNDMIQVLQGLGLESIVDIRADPS